MLLLLLLLQTADTIKCIMYTHEACYECRIACAWLLVYSAAGCETCTRQQTSARVRFVSSAHKVNGISGQGLRSPLPTVETPAWLHTTMSGCLFEFSSVRSGKTTSLTERAISESNLIMFKQQQRHREQASRTFVSCMRFAIHALWCALVGLLGRIIGSALSL